MNQKLSMSALMTWHASKDNILYYLEVGSTRSVKLVILAEYVLLVKLKKEHSISELASINAANANLR